MTQAHTSDRLSLDEVLIRKAGDSDLGFVLSTWIKGYRYSPEVLRVGRRVFLKTHKERMRKLIARSSVLVCCDRQERDELFAYVVLERLNDGCIIHWLYTKPLYREFGLARILLETCQRLAEGRPLYCSAIGAEKSDRFKTRWYDKVRADFHVTYVPTLKD